MQGTLKKILIVASAIVLFVAVVVIVILTITQPGTETPKVANVVVTVAPTPTIIVVAATKIVAAPTSSPTSTTTVKATVVIVTPTSSPTPTATSTSVPPTPTPTPDLSNITGWKKEWYRSPFRETTDWLKDPLTLETFAEPGVLVGQDSAQTAWDYMQDAETYMLVPEAGYTYFATGGFTLELVDAEASDKEGIEILIPILKAPRSDERIYLTIARGFPSDGGDTDFNQRILVGDYIQATGIYSTMPAGAYVSLDWMLQQIDNAFEPQSGIEDPNCGDNGCDEIYLVVVDLQTQTTRAWIVGPGLRDWNRVQTLN